MKTASPKSIRQLWQGQLVPFVPYIAITVIFIILPPLLPSYLQSIMAKILIFSIFAMSLDLLMGYTGLISLGHAAYFGMGGYTIGILMTRYGINSFWIGAPCGILMATLVAAVFGIIALRVSGIYFLLVTFALGQLLFSVAVKWYSVSGGEFGLGGILRPALGIPWFSWNATSFYYFVFLAFAICFFLLYRLVKSPFGHALQGIREGEVRMRVLGYNVWLYKYVTFIVAGAFAGTAGVFFAYHNGIMVPSHLGVITSGLVMLMVILGGLGTLYGPIIGVAVIIIMEFYAGIFAPERWPLILGVTFVVAIMCARAGIGVYLSVFWKRASLIWKQ